MVFMVGIGFFWLFSVAQLASMLVSMLGYALRFIKIHSCSCSFMFNPNPYVRTSFLRRSRTDSGTDFRTHPKISHDKKKSEHFLTPQSSIV